MICRSYTGGLYEVVLIVRTAPNLAPAASTIVMGILIQADRFPIEEGFETPPAAWAAKQSSSKASARVERDHLDLGHLFDGKARAFSPEPAIADAAIGHLIDAERRGIVDEHIADFELFNGLEGV